MNFFQFLQKFPTEQACIKHFIEVRYKGDHYCHHCASTKVYHLHTEPKLFRCGDCDNTFSIFKNTVFENSSTDLRKWMYAIHLFINGKKGISALQLQREIGVTYKTAWRILKQIRVAMGNSNIEIFEGTVEIDETYVGGRPRKGNVGTATPSRTKGKKGGLKDKTAVVGVINRDTKQAYAKIVLPDENGKRVTSKQILDILSGSTKSDAIVMTDQHSSYKALKNTDYTHCTINHWQKFAEGYINTNSIESFWSTLKRGIYGIYHQISPKHMQKYVDEFCFRYNNRENAKVFDLVLHQGIWVK